MGYSVVALDDYSVLYERDRGNSAAVNEIDDRFHDKLRLIVLTFQLTSHHRHRGYNPKKINRGGGMRDYPLHTALDRRIEKNNKIFFQIFLCNLEIMCIFAFSLRLGKLG